MSTHQELVCQISGRTGTRQNMLPAAAINAHVIRLLKKQGHKWDRKGYIAAETLNQLLMQHPEATLSDYSYGISADELEDSYQSSLSFGERMADRIADFGGSWSFILSFLMMIVVWIGINISGLLSHAYDPYPFILLNLVLSCIAAIQAPIIMMSQNRQESKDRLRAKNDYNINLKAEQEIRDLHRKVEELLNRVK